VRTDSFDYELPAEQIAQVPAARRDEARLLSLDRSSGGIDHRRFKDLGSLLLPGDVLVLNDAKVIAARLRGQKANSGGSVELLLMEEIARNEWWAMLRPGKRVRAGTILSIAPQQTGRPAIPARVVDKNSEGHCRICFGLAANIVDELGSYGELPLPPYIERNGALERVDDAERYQTVYARESGSIAAPTAGLHFTPAVLRSLRESGVEIHFLTLHVGLGTFAPVKSEEVGDHRMHYEKFEIPTPTADAINLAKTEGRRVIPVGTTSLRTLESVARQNSGRLVAGSARTNLFLFPPAEFQIADALLTNFHLPRSTLLMLVSAFSAPGETTRGRDLILKAYAEAIRERYRFFSYGDAMFIK
jgi:S-adenosylmethionine:tRNA ribosyltransferase-isomerase